MKASVARRLFYGTPLATLREGIVRIKAQSIAASEPSRRLGDVTCNTAPPGYTLASRIEATSPSR